MGLWDATFKVLSRSRPQDLLGLVPGVDATRGFRPIDKEFEPSLPLPRALDACLEYEDEDGEGTVFHLEFEAKPKSDTARRVFEHAALAHLVLKRPIRPVVLYLAPGEEGRRPHDSYRWHAGGREVVRFRFEKVCFWELQADRILERQAPALWAAVPLCRGATLSHVARSFRLLDERLEDPDARRNLEAALYWLAGTRFRRTDLMAVMPKEVLMKSVTYEATLEEGRQQGLEQGLEQGLKQGQEQGLKQGQEQGQDKGRRALAGMCRRLLEEKVGDLPPDASVLLESSDVEHLERLAHALLDAADPESALTALHREL